MHIVVVPLFLASDLAPRVAIAERRWLTLLLAAALVRISVGIQGPATGQMATGQMATGQARAGAPLTGAGRLSVA